MTWFELSALDFLEEVMASGAVPHLYSGPHLYDQVRLIDKSEGVVKYIGEIVGKNGTFYGLELLERSYHTATNNGSIGDQCYFTTTSNKVNVGRFVTDNEIQSIVQPTHNLPLIGESPPFSLGDRVFVEKKNCNGMVHYIGVPKFARTPKVFVGLELDEPKGNCNGSLAGCTYFQCDDNYGLYQVPKNLKLAQEEVTVDIDHLKHSENVEEKESKNQPQSDAATEQKADIQVQPESKVEPQPDPQPEPQSEPEAEAQPEPELEPNPEPQSNTDPKPEPKPAPEPEPELQPDPEPKADSESVPDPEPEPVVEPIIEPLVEPLVEPEPVIEPQKESVSKVVESAPDKSILVESKHDDDSKDEIEISKVPTLTPRIEVDEDGTETEYPTYMTNLCIKARTHDTLKNYKTINYSSRKYQVDDGLIQQKLGELADKDIAPRGHFVVDETKYFAYCLVKEPYEWRAALRINTDNANDAQKVLNFIQERTQEAMRHVGRIQTFNWDRNFHGLVTEIKEANM